MDLHQKLNIFCKSLRFNDKSGIGTFGLRASHFSVRVLNVFPLTYSSASSHEFQDMKLIPWLTALILVVECFF